MIREEHEKHRQEASRRIRKLILDNVPAHPRRLAPHIQDTYAVHRIDVYAELKKLVAEGVLAAEGTTGTRSYRLLRQPDPEPEPQPEPESEPTGNAPRPNTIMERERLERLAWQQRRKR
ncbi:MAG TPA: hypothetical protein VF267_00435 [Gammaproteobacteria bacterium]